MTAKTIDVLAGLDEDFVREYFPASLVENERVRETEEKYGGVSARSDPDTYYGDLFEGLKALLAASKRPDSAKKKRSIDVTDELAEDFADDPVSPEPDASKFDFASVIGGSDPAVVAVIAADFDSDSDADSVAAADGAADEPDEPDNIWGVDGGEEDLIADILGSGNSETPL